jgi:energy-coupling factor transport system permease protein
MYGLERGLSIALRFLLIVFSSLLFVSVTDPSLLAQDLTRVGIPYRYSFMLVVALRFLPLFESENHSVRLAQKSRGIEPDVRSVSGILRTVRYTFFPLLVSALSRVDALAMSMDGRGFGFADKRTFVRHSSWTATDTVFSVLIILYLAVCFLLAFGLVAMR